MDFELTARQLLLKQNAHAFIEKEIAPLVDGYEKKGIARKEADGIARRLIPLGYVSGPMPKEYGGQGLDFVSYGVLIEELARAWLALARYARRQTTLVHRIQYLGTEEQRRRFMPPVLTLDRTLSSGNSEPDAGSDSSSIQTSAVPDGEHYVINGTKVWSSAAWADWCLVLAVTDKAKGAKGGHSHFLVDKSVSPFTVKERHILGGQIDPICTVFFSDCRVPKENLLGIEPGSGHEKQLALWTLNRPVVALEAVGVAQAAIDASVRYARERRQFGKPIGRFQLIQEKIVDMVIAVDSARFLCLNALALWEKGKRNVKEASMSKAFATQMAIEVTSKAIEIHGAIGLCDDYPVERYFRDARVLSIPEGTTDINKLIAGREILGMSALA